MWSGLGAFFFLVMRYFFCLHEPLQVRRVILLAVNGIPQTSQAIGTIFLGSKIHSWLSLATISAAERIGELAESLLEEVQELQRLVQEMAEAASTLDLAEEEEDRAGSRY